jgi:hypothetical protein
MGFTFGIDTSFPDKSTLRSMASPDEWVNPDAWKLDLRGPRGQT